MKSLCEIGRIAFPKPCGIAINMMPFVMGDASSIPDRYRHYQSLIDACRLENEQIGTVGYLSIQESYVIVGTSQRRPGIHTDKHPSDDWGGGGWGSGNVESGARKDGIYVASTVGGSCRAWDLQIKMPGKMGNCEHLRSDLERLHPITMKADVLYWMTDSVPHESLPLETATFRQWFRLVTHKVGIWYEQHSTANPLGVLPSCVIAHGNKFAQATARS